MFQANSAIKVTLWPTQLENQPLQFITEVRQIQGNHLVLPVPQNLCLGAFLQYETLVGIEGINEQPEAQETSTLVKTKVLEVFFHEEILLFRVELSTGDSTPEDQGIERRRNIRVPLHCDLNLLYKPEGSPIAKTTTGKCINLSASGMRLISQVQVTKGSLVQVQFQPDHHHPKLHLQAIVVECKPLTPTTRSLSGQNQIAIAFQGITQVQEDFLVGVCFRKELEINKRLNPTD